MRTVKTETNNILKKVLKIKMIRLIWDIMQGISKGVKDIINASNPKDE